MNNEYRCGFCGYPVDPKGESTAELVTGWVIKSRLIQTDSRTWQYAHKVCVETDWDKVNSGVQETIF